MRKTRHSVARLRGGDQRHLILAARVPNYRVGDLDVAYATAGLGEDDPHVYGAMSGAVRALLHPRTTDGAVGEYRPTGLANEALAAVPAQFASPFVPAAEMSAWRTGLNQNSVDSTSSGAAPSMIAARIPTRFPSTPASSAPIGSVL
jgi:hypothetical protein